MALGGRHGEAFYCVTEDWVALWVGTELMTMQPDGSQLHSVATGVVPRDDGLYGSDRKRLRWVTFCDRADKDTHLRAFNPATAETVFHWGRPVLPGALSHRRALAAAWQRLRH